MNKVAIVYWSGTGNTEAMAEAVANGAKDAGAEVSLLTAEEFNSEMVANYDAFGFGCPAMGAEELEEDEFDPMFQACLPLLNGKKSALFGSYGWGDGEWMRNWEDTCRNAGMNLVCESVICQEAPDEEGVASCKALGADLAE